MENQNERKSLYKNQPGVALRMYAKKGMGDALFELTTNMHHTGDPDGPVDWVLCRTKDEPDTLWAFEFYKDQESFDRHYSDPVIDEGHQAVFDLLDGMPLRAEIHIVSSDKTAINSI